MSFIVLDIKYESKKYPTKPKIKINSKGLIVLKKDIEIVDLELNMKKIKANN